MYILSLCHNVCLSQIDLLGEKWWVLTKFTYVIVVVRSHCNIELDLLRVSIAICHSYLNGLSTSVILIQEPKFCAHFSRRIGTGHFSLIFLKFTWYYLYDKYTYNSPNDVHGIKLAEELLSVFFHLFFIDFTIASHFGNTKKVYT